MGLVQLHFLYVCFFKAKIAVTSSTWEQVINIEIWIISFQMKFQHDIMYDIIIFHAQSIAT